MFFGSIITALAVDSPVDLEAKAVAASLLILSAGAVAWPVFGPFLEIRRLAGKAGRQVLAEF
jgi:hypothetical protein